MTIIHAFITGVKRLILRLTDWLAETNEETKENEDDE